MNTTMKVLGGFLLGTAIGTVTGLLVAPDSGERTRKLLTKKSKKFSKEAFETANDYINQFKKEYNKQIDNYAENGKVKVDSVREAIKL